MYLSKDALEAEIVTAKSSEMNILVPKDDGDFVSSLKFHFFKLVILFIVYLAVKYRDFSVIFYNSV